MRDTVIRNCRLCAEQICSVCVCVCANRMIGLGLNASTSVKRVWGKCALIHVWVCVCAGGAIFANSVWHNLVGCSHTHTHTRPDLTDNTSLTLFVVSETTAPLPTHDRPLKKIGNDTFLVWSSLVTVCDN